MSKVKLGVNIDHVATVRNARGEIYPSPLRAAKLAEISGEESVNIHLSEDIRNIKNDLDYLSKKVSDKPQIINLINTFIKDLSEVENNILSLIHI